MLSLSLSKRVDLAVSTAKLVARNDEVKRQVRRKYAWSTFQDNVRSLGRQILQSRKNAEADEDKPEDKLVVGSLTSNDFDGVW